MKAIDAILQDTARNRGEARKLPPESDFLMKPLWTETREDREKKIRDLLDAALGVITDVPGGRHAAQDRRPAQEHPRSRRPHRQAAREAAHRAQGRHAAGPPDGHRRQPGQDVEETKKKIEANKGEIAAAKGEIHAALANSGIQLAPEQIDLLLDGVLSGDLVRLVAVFNSAKLIDGQLAKLMAQSGENITRRASISPCTRPCSPCWCMPRTA